MTSYILWQGSTGKTLAIHELQEFITFVDDALAYIAANQFASQTTVAQHMFRNTEQLGRLYLGESLGLITISVIFIAILLFRPTGLFGQRVR